MRLVPDSLPYPADFLLAQRCLEGDAKAIRLFQDRHRITIVGYLRKAGATEDEAEEVTESLWADCLKERPNLGPRLATYAGQSSLKTWLYPLALNRLITRKRQQRFWTGILDPEPDSFRKASAEERAIPADSEAPLLELMREAVQVSFQACPPEDFVLLQLAHVDQLHLTELARMFDCSRSTMHREVTRAAKGVADATLNYIRQADPWLVLTWADFLELCRVTSPATFGVE